MVKPVSLFRFLATHGGIRDDGGELRAMDLQHRFVPGRGRLVRASGMRLDMAREAAAEAGYMHRWGDRETAVANTTVADFLALVSEEHHGARVYAESDMAAVEAMSDAERQAETERLIEGEIDEALADAGGELPDEIRKRAAAIIAASGGDAADALETAILEDYYQNGGPEPVTVGDSILELEADNVGETFDDSHDPGLPIEREPVPQAGGDHAGGADNQAGRDDATSDGGGVRDDGAAPRSPAKPGQPDSGDENINGKDGFRVRRGLGRRGYQPPAYETDAVDMTAEAYCAALERVGMSQSAAGRFFGVTDVSGRRWALGGPPAPVAKMLRLMIAMELTPETVDQRVGRFWPR